MCQLITLKTTFFLLGAKYKLLRYVGYLKEVQGNADIIKI